jgi:hypothetical protein
MWKFIITMATPTKTLVAPGKPSLPTRFVQFLLDQYIVYIAKRLVIFAPKFAEKSPFLNVRLARGILLAVSFSLQMSTTMAIRAYGKDCLLF